VFLKPSVSLATDLTTNASRFDTGNSLLCLPTAAVPRPMPGPVSGLMPASTTSMQTSLYTWKPQTDKPYTCPKCGKGLSYIFTLNRHCKDTCGNVRNANGKWKCEHCPRSYKSKGNLVRHTRYGCGVPRQFYCVICNSAFTQRCSLIRHMKNQHNANDRLVQREFDKDSGIYSSTESLQSPN